VDAPATSTIASIATHNARQCVRSAERALARCENVELERIAFLLTSKPQRPEGHDR
jgi:cob(I)alamin adenosyltransferase